MNYIQFYEVIVLTAFLEVLYFDTQGAYIFKTIVAQKAEAGYFGQVL